MRKLTVLLVIGLFVLATAADSYAGRHSYNRTIVHHHDDDYRWDDHTSFDLDDGSIIITHERRGRDVSEVEFTEDFELYIDGEKIDLNGDQQALVREFYEHSQLVVDEAKAIGWEGAKIGVEGAKLGLNAIGCLFKLLSPNYDTDDFEDEIERKAEAIEDRAELLEERAEFIEDLVDDLDYLAADLCDAIPELDRLRWF